MFRNTEERSMISLCWDDMKEQTKATEKWKEIWVIIQSIISFIELQIREVYYVVPADTDSTGTS